MSLRILTLNVWGVPIPFNDRAARMKAIGGELGRLELDVAVLQEVFLEDNRETLIAAAAESGLVHSRRFGQGLLNNGLLFLSRHPIEAAEFWPFRLNGRPQDLIRPDFYAKKGLARISIPTSAGLLDIYNTHLIAPYLEIGDDVYFSHRVAQAYEISNLVREHSPDVAAIVAGDFNTTPNSLIYRTCRDIGGLEDSYAVANPDDPGVTVTTEIPYIAVHEPECIDYVFYRNRGPIELEVLSSVVAFTQVANQFQDEIRAYSDHYGVLTTFKLTSGQRLQRSASPPAGLQEEIRQALQKGLEEAQQVTAIHQRRLGLAVTVAVLTALVRRGVLVTRRQFLRLILGIAILAGSILAGVSAAVLGFEGKEVLAFESFLAEVDE